MANFETFDRKMVALKAAPLVTIQRRGAISLNRSAFAALGGPASVELLYDRDASIIGLRPVDGRAESACPVRRSSGSVNGPWVITAMAFLHFFDIDISVSRRWPAYLDGDILCLDLSRPGRAVTSNRARRDPPSPG